MKSYAKVNIFLKINGSRWDFHEISSRFMRVKNHYDDMQIVQKTMRTDKFTLERNFTCPLESNSIYRTYNQMLKDIPDPEKVLTFFKNHKVLVEKRIQEFGGFGGGPSNVATFLFLTNELCGLHMSREELLKIGSKVGSDVAFFLYDVDSANISGIGEVLEPFPENSLDLVWVTPNVQCSTGLVYTHYRNNFYSELSEEENQTYWKTRSIDVMRKKIMTEANDLCRSSLCLYPELREYAKDGWFMSGSGSTMFKPEAND